MLNNSWAPTATLLCTCILAGCAGSGQFSRMDYAQLNADPFLGAEADMESTKDDDTAEVPIASRKDTVEEAADRFAFVNQKNVANEITAVDFASRTASEISIASQSAEVAVGAQFDDFDQIHQAQTADKADDSSAWLDELDESDGKSDEVVQTSADFGDRTNQSGSPVGQSVQQAGSSTFSGALPKIDGQHADIFKERAKNDFVNDSDFGFGEPDEPLAKTSSEEEEKSSWPPANFKRL